MEISGKVLREVEFRDRLRGYDTDEVDEFLEKVAVAVDEMTARIAELEERGAPPAREPSDLPPMEDDSIRRTLVLAQRTADMAVREAGEEAAKLLADARLQSESLVDQAQDQVRRMRDEAEQDVHERVSRLHEERGQLEQEIRSLSALLENERDRLSQGLSQALRWIKESLAPSEELGRAAEAAHDDRPQEPEPQRQRPRAHERAASAKEPTALPDVERQIDEDAAAAIAPENPAEPQRPTSAADEVGGPLDTDDALWARWVAGEDEATSGPGSSGSQFHLDRNGLDRNGGNDRGGWSA